MLPSCLLSLFFVALSLLFASPALSVSLYDGEDALLQLDASNFSQTVLGNDKAWIIEFYLDWCGHCKRYAPIWKAFAREVENWRSVVGVAVINCAEDKNTPLCRSYNISTYPHIRILWHHATENDMGLALSGDRDIDSVEKFAIGFLESNWNQGVPPEWPNILPVESPSVNEILELPNMASDSMLLFVEDPESFTGRKVILDLSSRGNIMRRVLTSNTNLLNKLKNTGSEIPVVLKLYKTGADDKYLSFSSTNETLVRNEVFKKVIGGKRVKSKVVDPDIPIIPKDQIKTGLYMADLENAVYYSLTQEVGVRTSMDQDELSALKAYLSILSRHFPGKKPVVRFLKDLYLWSLLKVDSLQGEDFVQKIHSLQGKSEYLPELQDWVGCKGSTPDFRGYPCSLWTLFHTLSVQADISHEEMDGLRVLDTIKNYVRYFFTCEECRENFFKMDATLKQKLNSTSEVVLWLWEAHNKVNKRLSGDETDDPNHPKVQFPTREMCPKCHIESDGENIHWNKYHVLVYLHNFYRKENVLDSKGNQIFSSATMGPRLTMQSITSALLLIFAYNYAFKKSFINM